MVKNWNLRIAAAKKRKRFTDRDVTDSASWVTCACGRQDPRIPRIEDTFSAVKGRPYDGDLMNLGQQFYDRVVLHDTKGASTTLKAIEKRAKIVLKETLRKIKETS